MLCPSCGKKNNDYHLFCYQCGTALTTGATDTSYLYNEQDHSTNSKGSDTQNENSESSIDFSKKDWSIDNEEQSTFYDLPKENDTQSTFYDWTRTKEELSASSDDNEKNPEKSATTEWETGKSEWDSGKSKGESYKSEGESDKSKWKDSKSEGALDKSKGESDKPEDEKNAVSSIWSKKLP